jgi:hypothetical protein
MFRLMNVPRLSVLLGEDLLAENRCLPERSKRFPAVQFWQNNHRTLLVGIPIGQTTPISDIRIGI